MVFPVATNVLDKPSSSSSPVTVDQSFASFFFPFALGSSPGVLYLLTD